MAADEDELVPAIHPGEFVWEDVLVPLKLDVPTAAKKMGLSVDYLQGLVERRQSVDQKAAEALGALVGNGPTLWIRIQTLYDRWQESQPLTREGFTFPVNAYLLGAVAPRQRGVRAQHQAWIIEGLGKSLGAILQQYKINTPIRLAHFLAQTCHESDGFCTTEEYASGAAYEGRADLGNTEPGDGRRFKGRGLIQLTGRANYAAASGRLGIKLIDNPDLAAVPATSLLIACDYWRQHHINTPSDRDDIITVTRLVNGGLNGLDSRRGYLAKAKEVLARLQAGQLPSGSGVPLTLYRGMQGEDVIRLQKALSDRNFSVTIDGTFGPGTETAVRLFQASIGLTTDGIVGPATWSKLV